MLQINSRVSYAEVDRSNWVWKQRQILSFISGLKSFHFTISVFQRSLEGHNTNAGEVGFQHFVSFLSCFAEKK